MLVIIVKWLTTVVLRITGMCLVSYFLGSMIGKSLGKRHIRSYVHEFIDKV